MWKFVALSVLFCSMTAGADDAFGKYYRNTGEIRSLLAVSDGYVVLVDHFDDSGQAELQVLKLLPTGKVLWKRAFRSAFALYGEQIIATNDGGFAITGSRYSSDIGPSDILLVKLNSAGNLQWTRKYFTYGWEGGMHIVQTKDGGFLIAAYSGAALILLRVDHHGNQVWVRSWEGEFPQPISLIERNGLYVVTAVRQNDLIVAGIDANGQIRSSMGVRGDSFMYFTKIVFLPDGGFAVTGLSYSSSGQLFVGRYDATGRSRWFKAFTYDGPLQPVDIALTGTGDIFISGDLGGAYPSSRVFLLRLSVAGKILDTRGFGREVIQSAGPILGLPGGQVLVSGTTDFNMFQDNWATLFKMDSDLVPGCSLFSEVDLTVVPPPKLQSFDPLLSFEEAPFYVVTAPEIQTYSPPVSGQFLCK